MFFNDPVEDQARAVKSPVLLCPAENDPENVKEGGDVQTLVREVGFSCDIVEFPHMKHGWVPRGDASDPNVARDVAVALKAANDFFLRHL
jgi:hypothetical protein